MTRASLTTFVAACLLSLVPVIAASQQLSPALQQKIDQAAQSVLKKTGVPSAQLGIARNGRIVYTTAYGQARLHPPQAATARMHYAVGSISKQFTTACILILQQQGKLKLDDPVGKWFPELSGASQVTIRNLLTHTSGYSDYAPQDYTIPKWTKPTTPQAIVHEWATKPLDFPPGTEWQYSNTNFNIAGLIIEKASGQAFWQFLQTNVLDPLDLTNVWDLDKKRSDVEPIGYMRNAFGPLRPAIPEAPGWYFADGELGMPVADLLTWDLSIIHRSLLQSSSYDQMETEFRLKNGLGTSYGLGLHIGSYKDHRLLSHGGEVGGFVANNTIYPDDKIAIAVLTNQEASSAASAIAREVSDLLFADSGSRADAQADRQVKSILAGLQNGKLDRSLFTANANFYFTPQAISDYQQSLSKLGTPTAFESSSIDKRGGMTGRTYSLKWSDGTQANLSCYWLPNGKIEQYLIEPQS